MNVFKVSYLLACGFAALHAEAVGEKPTYLRLQVLLDRAHCSPGEIDGVQGTNTTKALRVFRAIHGSKETSDLAPKTWRALEGRTQVPTLISYTITEGDVRGPFFVVPNELMDQANLPALGFQSAAEALGEKFHIKPSLLSRLNPGKDLGSAGTQIEVPNLRADVPGRAVKVVVSKSKGWLEALNAAGHVVAEYPTTSGSEHDPLPIGKWKIVKIDHDPLFYYNPALFWNAPASDAKAVIQPGPNNPVGVVWIGISKEHYGIHGTPEPGLIGHAESHGCVRLTNWDAAELASIIRPGMSVIFTE